MSAGLTQRELAELVGTAEAAIGHWEIGTHRPTPAWLARLAAALGIDVGDLTGASETTLVLLRLRQGWTQDDLARVVGVSDMTISRLERGLTPLSPATAGKLSEALLTPVDEIVAAYEHGRPATGSRGRSAGAGGMNRR